MKKILLSVLALSLAIPYASHAKAAKVLKVSESVEIKASPDKVWEKVSNFGDLGGWHPAVKTTEIVSGENGVVGAVRLLTLQDGGTLKETLLSIDPKKMRYSYNIVEGVLPVSEYTSTVSVSKAKKDQCKVTWSGEFKRKDISETPAAGQDDTTATKTMSSVYRGGLDNLKTIMETK
ncbi:MAG: SRPBCC family protein [Fibrobacteria bacterium]